MDRNTAPATTPQSRQLNSVLIKFYSNPIARVSFELFLTIGAILFFGLFAIRPTLVTMSNLIRELEQKRELDQQLSQKIAALSSAQNQLAQVESRLPIIDEAIPTSPEFLRAVTIIEKIASDNSLTITGISSPEIPKEVDASNLLNSTATETQLNRINIPMSVSVQGEYPVIRSFIEGLLQSRRTILVDSVTFSVNEDQGEKSIAAAITISISYFESAPLAPAGTGTTTPSSDLETGAP